MENTYCSTHHYNNNIVIIEIYLIVFNQIVFSTWPSFNVTLL